MEKLAVYQVLARLWGTGRLSSFDDEFFGHVRSLGMNAVWYTGIPRHSTGKDFVKGDPGSPYSITDWFDINPYLADNEDERLEEFESLVARTHAAGLKVITDFIPNHVSPDNVNGIPTTGRCDFDWTDTRKIDYSDPATVPALAAVLRFWASHGVDGFRCDMVELVSRDALRTLISSLRLEFPELLFIAEVYDQNSYGAYVDAGFDLLYDKSGLYDALRAIIGGDSARRITWNWQRNGALQDRMLNFLENHDEQRLPSPFFAGSADRGFAALAVGALFNGASMMLYSGQEVGEDASESDNGRTSIFNWSRPAALRRLHDELHGTPSLLPEERRTLHRYRTLMPLALSEPFLSGANYDLGWCQGDGFDPDRHFAFLRYDAAGDAVAVVCNFSGDDAPVTVRIPEGCAFRACTLNVPVPAWDAAIIKIQNDGKE